MSGFSSGFGAFLNTIEVHDEIMDRFYLRVPMLCRRWMRTGILVVADYATTTQQREQRPEKMAAGRRDGMRHRPSSSFSEKERVVLRKDEVQRLREWRVSQLEREWT